MIIKEEHGANSVVIQTGSLTKDKKLAILIIDNR
jgi:hypothetical protein